MATPDKEKAGLELVRVIERMLGKQEALPVTDLRPELSDAWDCLDAVGHKVPAMSDTALVGQYGFGEFYPTNTAYLDTLVVDLYKAMLWHAKENDRAVGPHNLLPPDYTWLLSVIRYGDFSALVREPPWLDLLLTIIEEYEELETLPALLEHLRQTLHLLRGFGAAVVRGPLVDPANPTGH